MSEKLNKDQQIKSLGDAVEAYTLTIRNLREKVESLESELKEYKRCAVVGGDGKPLHIGQIRFVMYDEPYKKGIVGKIEKIVQIEGETEVTAKCVVTGKRATVPHRLVFASVEDVPGGDT